MTLRVAPVGKLGVGPDGSQRPQNHDEGRIWAQSERELGDTPVIPAKVVHRFRRVPPRRSGKRRPFVPEMRDQSERSDASSLQTSVSP
jgi:hypothetical protein